MDIMLTIEAVRQGLAIVKDLRQIDTDLSEAEFKSKIATLMGTLADTNVALSQMKEQFSEKDAEIARLKKAFEFRGKLVECKGYKYEDRGNGRPQGLPFCPRCEARDAFFIRLTYSQGMIEMTCPQCKAKYKGASGYTYPEKAG